MQIMAQGAEKAANLTWDGDVWCGQIEVRNAVLRQEPEFSSQKTAG